MAEEKLNLVTELQLLRLRAGQPSTRVLARKTGAASHTTLAQMFRGDRIPRWPVVAATVECLGGDVDTFLVLWTESCLSLSPDWVTCPGETLAEWLADVRLPRSVFRKLHGIPENILTGLLAGTAPLTSELADALQRVTFIPASFWLALEHNYRAGLAAGLKHEHAMETG